MYESKTIVVIKLSIVSHLIQQYLQKDLKCKVRYKKIFIKRYNLQLKMIQTCAICNKDRISKQNKIWVKLHKRGIF